MSGCGSLLLAAGVAEPAIAPISSLPSPGATRTRGGLQALYDFSSSNGAFVNGRSGARQPVDLRVVGTNSVRRSEGSLEVRDTTLIRSEQAAIRIADAVRLSGEITVEAWIRPAQTNQTGPARIITLSKDTSERNFTLGQDGDHFDVRFRTTQTTTNGTPSLSSKPGSLTTNLTHVVYTRDRGGRTRLYLNGETVVEQIVPGDTANWEGMLDAMGASRRLGPPDREKKAIDAIRA